MDERNESVDPYSGWSGKERRTIPFEIINFVDDRISTHTTEVVSRLEAKEKSDAERHHALVERFTVIIGDLELVKEAFLTDEHGKPDFHGHRYDHGKRKRFSAWVASMRGRVIEKLVEWVSMGAIAWAGFAAWEAFLKGPRL